MGKIRLWIHFNTFKRLSLRFSDCHSKVIFIGNRCHHIVKGMVGSDGEYWILG